MHTYRVVVRTTLAAHVREIPADSTAEAAELAATQFANVPCGITVQRPCATPTALLRQLITQAVADIPMQQRASVSAPSGLNFVFASGAVDAIPLDLGDRRFFVMAANAIGADLVRA